MSLFNWRPEWDSDKELTRKTNDTGGPLVNKDYDRQLGEIYDGVQAGLRGNSGEHRIIKDTPLFIHEYYAGEQIEHMSDETLEFMNERCDEIKGWLNEEVAKNSR